MNLQKSDKAMILLALCTIIMLWIRSCYADYCMKDFEIGIANVYKTEQYWGKNPGSRVYFKYEVNGFVYDRTWGVNLKYDENINRFQDLNLPLVYSKREPTYIDLLVSPEDFTEYGLAYPDSLKWIDDLLP